MSLNEDALKFVLEQNLSTTKSFVQMLFDNLKKEIDSLRQESWELKNSLEFSQKEITDLKNEVIFLKNRTNTGQSSSTQNSSAGIPEISERVRVLEDSARSKNIRITGLEELKDENSEQTQHKVNKLIKEKLKLKDIHALKSFRAGKTVPKTNAELKENPRAVIVELSSETDKIACFRSSKTLKGTNIYISDDVSRTTQDIRRQKLDILKKKREEGYIAYFSGINIITKPKQQRSNEIAAGATSQASAVGNSNGGRNMRSKK